MTNQPAGDWSQVNPKLRQLTDEVLFGDVWERPGLSKRDRSLITVAMLTALYRTEQLRNHISRALDNGVTQDELIEVITHATMYGGWPVGANGSLIAKQVFEARAAK